MSKHTYAVRYAAGKPIQHIRSEKFNELLHELPIGKPLTTDPHLQILVWNIYKQQRANWLQILQRYTKNTQLILLQEARTTPELIDFALKHYLTADQVPALALPLYPSGVMTLAATHPLYSCPLSEREPLLPLLKSALVAVYPLYDQRLLMIVNIHAINFSLGVNVYLRQLETIGTLLRSHRGPAIMAGDFNAWNQPRITTLYQFAEEAGLQEVGFEQDHRKRAFGRPLDFVFCRQLQVKDARVINTRASDHNPLLVSFDCSATGK